MRLHFVPHLVGGVALLLIPAHVQAAAIVQARRRRAASAVPATTTVWVSKSGSDANDGLSAGSPVLTLVRANAIAAANGALNTVAVQGAGTWAEQLTAQRGGMTYVATGGAVIDGGGPSAGRNGISVSSKANVTIDGFDITNTDTTLYALIGTSCSGLKLQNLRIYGAPRGVFLSSCSGPQLLTSLLHDVTYRHGAELRTCSGALVQDVEGYACAGRVLYFYGTHDSIVRRFYGHDCTTSDYAFEMEAFGTTGASNNLILDSWAGNTTGQLKWGFICKISENNRFQRCVAFNCGYSTTGGGFYFKDGEGWVYHCDSYGNVYGVYVGSNTPGDDAPSANVKLFNSIIKNNTTLGVYVQPGSEDGFDSNNNLWHGNASLANYGGGGYSQASWQGAGFDTNSLFSTDPLYATVVKGGFVPGASGLNIGADLGEGAGLKVGHTASTYGA